MPDKPANPVGSHRPKKPQSTTSRTAKNAGPIMPLGVIGDNRTGSEVKTSSTLVFADFSGGDATGGGIQFTKDKELILTSVKVGGAELGAKQSDHGTQAPPFQTFKIEPAEGKGARVKLEDSGPESANSEK
ncbi:hypothetical protein NUW58_g2705 [Xylaria curta]|uniref:Uncharacterized protein n=1 Tax=Xylaria curta TaxID=42375 RepID=A0ACC1PFG4_9PEZI|nr:hypothetical protein NUW58_g2705 [Xylaria curta]